ncbi:MAG: hypothetical protein U0Z75_06010 [Deinococcaceae bacterium]
MSKYEATRVFGQWLQREMGDLGFIRLMLRRLAALADQDVMAA